MRWRSTNQDLPALALGIGVTAICVLPVLLVGTMAVQIAEELEFGALGIGAAVSAFFGTVAVSSVSLGRVTDRIGATVSLRIAAAVSAVSSAGIALLASNGMTLTALLMLAGVGQALAQPAANRMLVHRVRLARMGTAFGIKQAAPPAAAILAGLSVPALALTVGWRWAYVLVALGAIVLAKLVGRRLSSASPIVSGPSQPPSPLQGRPALVILGIGFALAMAASSAVLAFYVEAAVQAGASPALAGFIFALGGVAVVLTRLLAGVACDHPRFAPLSLSAALLGLGAVGLGLLATNEPLPMAMGAVVALMGTWGFPGAFWFALVMAYPESPGRITGTVAPAAVGGLVGPMGFGAVAALYGYPYAWILTAGIAVLAGIFIVAGARRLAG